MLKNIYYFFRYGSYNMSNKQLALVKSYKLFEENNVLFIHIPKTAGISLYKAIYGKDSYGHVSIKDYNNQYGERSIQKMFRFTIVRNPYDRLKSAYDYLKKGGRGRELDLKYQEMVSEYADFEYFVEKFYKDYDIMEFEHFIPQSYWFLDQKDNIAVDYIGRFENINHEFNTLIKKIPGEVANDHLPKLNFSSKRKEYKFSPDTIKRINEIYRIDFELLGYQKIECKY